MQTAATPSAAWAAAGRLHSASAIQCDPTRSNGAMSPSSVPRLGSAGCFNWRHSPSTAPVSSCSLAAPRAHAADRQSVVDHSGPADSSRIARQLQRGAVVVRKVGVDPGGCSDEGCLQPAASVTWRRPSYRFPGGLRSHGRKARHATATVALFKCRRLKALLRLRLSRYDPQPEVVPPAE